MMTVYLKQLIALSLLMLHLTVDVVRADITCYDCYFQRVLGVEQGQIDCEKPNKETTNTISCTSECIISTRVGNIGGDRDGEEKVSDRDRYTYMYRGCAHNCQSDSYSLGGYTGEHVCCDSNYCNNAQSNMAANKLILWGAMIGFTMILMVAR